jgi:DNA-binding transcriptional ArsR family regulator
MDCVFRALAHESRRLLLDGLFARRGLTLGQLAALLPMSRQAVAKHLAILEAANLVVTHWHGREKLHYLNPVPIGEIVRRWVGKFEDARLEALADFKDYIEYDLEKRHA